MIPLSKSPADEYLVRVFFLLLFCVVGVARRAVILALVIQAGGDADRQTERQH